MQAALQIKKKSMNDSLLNFNTAEELASGINLRLKLNTQNKRYFACSWRPRRTIGQEAFPGVAGDTESLGRNLRMRPLC